MVRVRRIDAGELARPVRRSDGSMVVQARIARTGVQIYKNADGSRRREYRSDVEVAKSAASFKLVPYTLYHPPVMVSAENVTQYQRGTVGESINFDGKWLNATIAVHAKDAVAALEAGMTQISCGYDCDLDMTPGVTPDGEHYDCSQLNIIGNHVAGVPDARAGAEAAVRMDAACSLHPDLDGTSASIYSDDMTADVLAAAVSKALSGIAGLSVTIANRPTEVHVDTTEFRVHRRDASVRMYETSSARVRVTSFDMTAAQLNATLSQALAASLEMQLRIDHKEPTMNLEQALAALAAANTKIGEQTARADAAERELKDAKASAAKLEAERDAQKERADAAEKARKDATDATPLRVRARVELEGAARRVLGARCDAAEGKPAEIDLTKLGDRAVKLAVIKHVTNADCDLDAAGKPRADEYIDARYDAAIERAAASADTFRETRDVIEGHRHDSGNTGGKKRNDARAEMIKANREGGLPAKTAK